jgi:hypothetical protein
VTRLLDVAAKNKMNSFRLRETAKAILCNPANAKQAAKAVSYLSALEAKESWTATDEAAGSSLVQLLSEAEPFDWVTVA